MDIQIAESLDKVEGTVKEVNIARKVCEKLNQVYPGYYWHVGANGVDTGNNGIVTICCATLSMEVGYNLFVSTVLNDPDLKCVVKAGGMILETFGVSRARMNETQVMTAANIGGRVLFDPNALNKGKVEAPKFVRDWWNKKTEIRR
jgi:hypothetical protein